MEERRKREREREMRVRNREGIEMGKEKKEGTGGEEGEGLQTLDKPSSSSSSSSSMANDSAPPPGLLCCFFASDSLNTYTQHISPVVQINSKVSLTTYSAANFSGYPLKFRLSF